MKNGNKTLRLAAYHFFQMGKFLFPLYALLLAWEVFLINDTFIMQCQANAPVGFQNLFSGLVFPVLFCAAFVLTFAGMLLYFLRFTGSSKSVYTLRTLPMGADGLLQSMLLAMLAAVLLLWLTQYLAVFVGHRLFLWDVERYNLPGGANGLSRLMWAPLPPVPWSPPANDLYLTFVRTPFLQLFYPRHPFSLLLAVLAVLLPVISGTYLAVSSYGRRWGAVVLTASAWLCIAFLVMNGFAKNVAWNLSGIVTQVFGMLYLLASLAYMLFAARTICKKSKFG